MTTIIVEDGTKPAGANSYVSLADAITYHTNWQNTAFTNATTADQSLALLTACYSMEKLYGRHYAGYRVPTSKQTLLWPRTTFLDVNNQLWTQGVVPQPIIDAQCELALMFLGGTSLFPNESENRLYAQVREKFGAAYETDKKYWEKPKDVEYYDGFRKVELILWPLLRRETKNVRMGL